eukprot:COSAG02_NODE_824_length_16741_cov_16.319733_4_plen_184_part_00
MSSVELMVGGPEPRPCDQTQPILLDTLLNDAEWRCASFAHLVALGTCPCPEIGPMERWHSLAQPGTKPRAAHMLWLRGSGAGAIDAERRCASIPRAVAGMRRPGWAVPRMEAFRVAAGRGEGRAVAYSRFGITASPAPPTPSAAERRGDRDLEGTRGIFETKSTGSQHSLCPQPVLMYVYGRL